VYGDLLYSCRVTGFKQFLPKGPVASSEPPAYDGIRKQDLVQLYTDSGLRTLAVADISLKDPRRR
jgi:hypothetical protein